MTKPGVLAAILLLAGCSARVSARDAHDAGAGPDGGTEADLDGGDRVWASNPFGIATSASSSREPGSWAPAMAAAGIGSVRGFDTSDIDARLAVFAENHLEVSGILMSSGSSSTSTFPVNDLPGWSRYVTSITTACKGRVDHWEVWNEPPNFTDDKSPADYATVVSAAYDAAKAVDPSIQIGLAVQSVNLNWLEQAISAGAADHFDYVTVHPYETMGLVASGWEAEYMSIVPTIRKMLAATDPARVNVPIRFTEIGEPVGSEVTPEHQAETAVKAYVMGLAQGVERIHWFEGKDGDSGPFGLIDASGQRRPAYGAVASLIAQLGPLPRYHGWVLLNGKSYGFVFRGVASEVLVAWAPPGESDSISFASPVQIIDPVTGTSSEGASATLTPAPLILVGVPTSLVSQARQSNGKALPWGGDFSNATSVSFHAPTDAAGLHATGVSKIVTVDGEAVRDCSDAPAQNFTVDPSFLSYTPSAIQITAVVRRNGDANAGFNLKYESTSGWKGMGSWYTVPGSDAWYTQSWTIRDDEFVGKWGINFAFDSDSTALSGYSIKSVTVTKL